MLRVVSFNTFYAIRKKRLAKSVFTAFAKLNPDVICLQEVLIGKKRNFARDLADHLGYHLSFSLRAEFRKRQIGLVILTKKPTEESTSIILPRSLKRRPRILQTVRIKIRGASWRIANTHLSVASFGARRTQLAAVIATVSTECRATPIILAGDFNTRTKKEVAIFNAMLRTAGFRISKKIPYSWNMLGIKGKFDWIAAKNCSIRNAGILQEVKGSDHKPIWADMAPR